MCGAPSGHQALGGQHFRGRVDCINRAQPGRFFPAGAARLRAWFQPNVCSLELLEKTFFSFASCTCVAYPIINPTSEPFPSMIVCSCNVLSDHDVRRAVSVAELPPRTPGQVYGCLGCSAQCGRCARTIKQIMDEALGPCARACCSGCPHSHASAEPDGQVEFALAAS